MLKLKLQYSGHLMQTVNLLVKSLMLGKIEGRRRGRQKMRRHHQSNGHELGQTLRDDKGQGGCSPCGCTELDTTGWLNINNID